MTNDTISRCRIGENYFGTRDEAEEWVAAGNIGGTYSIVYQVFCPDHLDWFDEVYDRVADEHVCSRCCGQRQLDRAAERRAQLDLESQRRAELARLRAWNEGRSIVPD